MSSEGNAQFSAPTWLTLAAPLTSAAVRIANELQARSGGAARGQPAPPTSG